MNKNIFIISLLFCLCGAAAFSQEKEDGLSLSFTEAQIYALEHNRQLQSADIAVQKAEKAKWESIATLLPHVDASGTYNSYMGFKMNFAGMSIPMNPYGTLTGSVTEAVNGLMIIAYQLNKLACDMSALNRESGELDIKANVATAYYSILIAEESKRILEQSYKNIEHLNTSTKSMVAVGMAEQTDADLIKVQMLTMENGIRASERNIELAYNSLRLLLGVEPTLKIVITDSLESLIQINTIRSSIENSFNVNNNINVLILNKNVELSKKQVALQKWNYAPTLSSYYQYNAKTYFGKDEGFNMTPPNTMGLTLSIPVFSSGERLSKVRQAKLDLQAAELNRQEAIDGLLVQEKQLRFNIISALETYEVQKTNVEVYNGIFDRTSEKYEQGMASSIDLVNISNNLLTAQSSYIQSLMELLLAHVNFQKLLNNL